MTPAPLVALLRVLVAVCVLGASAARAQGTGSVAGRVFDADSGEPIAGASVVLQGAAPADGGAAFQQVATTGADGGYRFGSVPEGSYTLRFTKSGYRASRLADLTVQPGQVANADFPLPRAATGTAEQILELEAFAVEASTVEEGADLLELRLDADQFLNTLSAAEFAKFAASDVGEALKRVAGVNVVGGQFAVIRGLEDRYNSTLFNSAPVPSPDPDRQSVQLDLFPSDIVSNLVVSKTFVADLPSNTSGGGIDIATQNYPETLTIKLSSGAKLNDRAFEDEFLRVNRGSPVGSEVGQWDVLGSDYGLFVGGRSRLLERELRYVGVLNREVTFKTAEGIKEKREPLFGVPGRIGDLAAGELSLSGGRFELVESERAEQRTGFFGLGMDLDEAGDHRIDAALFYTKKDEEIVEQSSNGHFPTVDYEVLRELQRTGAELPGQAFGVGVTPGAWMASVRSEVNDFPSRGALWFASFSEEQSFVRDRDLGLLQLNGEHRIDELIPGLRISWAANRARTTQDDESRAANVRFEVDEPENLDRIPERFPATVDALGAGTYFTSNGILFSTNEIEERQDFARVDAEYDRRISDGVDLELRGGLWYENADRDVAASYQQLVSVRNQGQFAIAGNTLEDLGERIFKTIDATGLREVANESSRQIRAWNLSGKATLWERFDLLGGVRRENIFLESLNDPFIGVNSFDGSPAIFPTKWLLFDRFDNPARRELAPVPGATFNDQLLGIRVPIGPCRGLNGQVLPGDKQCVDLINRQEIEALLNGEIDETKILPHLGFAFRPLEGLSVRGAYSRTVARPSLREIGYYVSVEPGSDDLIIGNPQLQLSDVESWDARVEYVWGGVGDLAAVSVFSKVIEDPIEVIVIRDPANRDLTSSALFRTFFNNPSEATVRGIEVEMRKNAGFLGLPLARYFSVGGNFSYIDAEVDRTDAELARSRRFFFNDTGTSSRFPKLEESRRLFNQPEWIANLDLSFDHPEWGTKVTLAFNAISDVLDAAGAAALGPDGSTLAFTVDRYVDSFYQLDLVASQTVRLRRGELTFKLSAKNLTDSERRLIYDPEQTRDEIAERDVRVGRDYSFSLSYSFSF
jgi:hypothetical protein